MTKITIALLALTAFIYAVFLVLTNRQLPKPKNFSGGRRRFILATLLFVGLMGKTSVMGRESRMMCHKVALPATNVPQHALVSGLKAIWRTLDPKYSEEFRSKLEAAAGRGTIRRKTADMLAIAFSEIAYHKQRSGGKEPKVPIRLCYMIVPKSLDLKNLTSAERRQKALKQHELLHKAQQSGAIDLDTAAKAYDVLARDVDIKAELLSPPEDRPKMTCYLPNPIHIQHMTTKQYAEKALKQLELLRKARQSGKIDTNTAAKVHAVLEHEVQMLYQAKHRGLAQWLVAKKDKPGQTVVSDSASVAAAIIVEMEDGQVPEFTAAKRLATMKERVEKLLKEGPIGNDWIDPAIHPNVSALLEKAGLADRGLAGLVLCYMRAAAPVQARSDELKKLQQQLLDKNVKAGVLDAEVAEKAAEAAANEKTIDYATEMDIQNYQKKLRRAVRLLYKNGELPSSFVNELAKTVDIDIIAFDSAKALRNDARFHLRSVLWGPVGNKVLTILEKRKLIPPARNYRRIMNYFGSKPQLSEQQNKQLTDFQALIDGESTFELPGDEKVKIKKWQIPKDNVQYRLQVRTVCRALVKTNLVNNNQLKQVEELIAVPIIGTLEAK